MPIAAAAGGCLYARLFGWAVAVRSGLSTAVESEVRALGLPVMGQVLRETDEPLCPETKRLASRQDVPDDLRRELGEPHQRRHVPLARSEPGFDGVQAFVAVLEQRPTCAERLV